MSASYERKLMKVEKINKQQKVEKVILDLEIHVSGILLSSIVFFQLLFGWKIEWFKK